MKEISLLWLFVVTVQLIVCNKDFNFIHEETLFDGVDVGSHNLKLNMLTIHSWKGEE
jgi:hypothetical protein